jgi:SP family general alpha glucoside:H+ symporter-like MFS transporter
MDTSEKGIVTHEERDLSNSLTTKAAMIDPQMATDGNAAEHNMTTWQALKRYKKATLWSMLVSTCIIMRAYDIEITGSLYAQPAFSRDMGEYLPGHGYQVPAKWQIAMSMGGIVGQAGGAWLAAFPMDRFGRKKTLIGYLLAVCAIIFMQVFTPNRTILVVSMYLAGFIWGGFHVIAPLYAAECLPLRLRPYLTTYVQLCYSIGQFFQTGIVKAFVNRTDVWAWKIPYAIQWVWPVFILSFSYWLPESPWWLVRKNRLDDAKKALDHLSNKEQQADNANTLALMVETDAYERDQDLGSTYLDCFKGSNRRRLEICSMVFIAQNFSGNPVGFATYLFNQIGLSTDHAFDMSLGLAGLGMLGTMICPFILPKIGRRPLWLSGLTYCAISLWIVALLSFAKNYKTTPAYSWVQAVLLIVVQFIFALSLGALGYIVSSEIPSTRLRAKTLSLTASINGFTYLILTVMGPVLLNPGAANAGAKTEFLFGGISTICLVWGYFRLPEVSIDSSASAYHLLRTNNLYRLLTVLMTSLIHFSSRRFQAESSSLMSSPKRMRTTRRFGDALGYCCDFILRDKMRLSEVIISSPRHEEQDRWFGSNSEVK